MSVIDLGTKLEASTHLQDQQRAQFDGVSTVARKLSDCIFVLKDNIDSPYFKELLNQFEAILKKQQ